MNERHVERVRIRYTNHRGITEERVITPERIVFAATDYHPAPQWLLQAFCHERQAMRLFAVSGVHAWRALEPNEN